MKPKRDAETFAEILDEVSETPSRGTHLEWSSPIGEREWYDEASGHWHMRGHPLDAREMRRLLKRSGIRVMHFYGGVPPSEVSGAARDDLVARVEEFFKGKAPPHNEFRLADFRTDQGAVMLVVVEFC